MTESEATCRAILAAALDGVIIIDHRGTIRSMNPAAERLFGYAAREVVERNVSMLMPEPDRSRHGRYIRSYLRTGKGRIIGTGREVAGRRKDGSIFPMYLAVSEVRVGERRLFIGIAHDMSERRRLEREILRAGAREQERIGRDLHDGLCQQLAAIAYATEGIRQRLADESPPAAPRVAAIGRMIDDAMTEARRVARGLRVAAMDGGGLEAALRELAASARRLYGVGFRVQVARQAAGADGEVAMQLYRIAQESVNNAVRHGKAKRIEIRLGAGRRGLSMTIADDGAGFRQGRRGGMGLPIMRYRAMTIGGTFEICRRRGGGTRVRCSVPASQIRTAVE